MREEALVADRAQALAVLENIEYVALEFCKPMIRGKVIAAIAATCIFAHGESASAQYVYQPAPDYYHNDTASDTVIGGLLGAATGAIAGGHKHAGAGALIGAGVGAVTGNLVGQSKDRSDERKAAAGAATAASLNQQAAAMAVTNADLVGMTRAGVSDDLIVSTMRSAARSSTSVRPRSSRSSKMA